MVPRKEPAGWRWDWGMEGGEQLSKSDLHETERSGVPRRVIASAVSDSKAVGWRSHTEAPWLAGGCCSASLAAQALPLQLVSGAASGSQQGKVIFPASHHMDTLS